MGKIWNTFSVHFGMICDSTTKTVAIKEQQALFFD